MIHARVSFHDPAVEEIDLGGNAPPILFAEERLSGGMTTPR